MSPWQDKSCLITGGSAGLGLALGQALAERGARVVLVARRQGPLDAAVAQITARGGRATAIAGDAAIQADVGRLDMLCNCAGRSTRAAVLDTTPADFQELLDVNFFATVRMARAFAPQLIAARGHLVNIGSLASKVAAPYLGAYPASKHAVAAYTQQLRLELGPQGLHVLFVCPGPITRDDSGERYVEDSPEVPAEAQAPGGGARIRTLSPTDLAAQILSACEQRRPDLVVPAKARLLFALSQLSAGWGDWLLRRQLKGPKP
jgi:short-subunit dehydrogenase